MAIKWTVGTLDVVERHLRDASAPENLRERVEDALAAALVEFGFHSQESNAIRMKVAYPGGDERYDWVERDLERLRAEVKGANIRVVCQAASR